MQAQWVRTPVRLAGPVNRISGSHLNSTHNQLAPLSLLPRHTSSPTRSTPAFIPLALTRPSSSASSRWKLRQGSDPFARSARVQGLKSRAAFKLLELDSKYHLFRRGKGQVVVDLGYAPGSWSQVAVDRTSPNGTVVGIDLIPAQPPKGVSTIQGNFLSPEVQGMVKQVLVEGEKRRVAARAARKGRKEEAVVEEGGEGEGDMVADRPSYIDMERMSAVHEGGAGAESGVSSGSEPSQSSQSPDDATHPAPTDDEKPNLRLVDVVLSDMMMNTSGIPFKDHAGSMDLCHAALTFASETLKPGGHFVCKFYQGAEDKAFETLLRKMFAKVHREKPESSRSESREAFFVALRRKGEVTIEDLQGQ